MLNSVHILQKSYCKKCYIAKLYQLSIHATHEGSDLAPNGDLCLCTISIHAAQVGSDGLSRLA